MSHRSHYDDLTPQKAMKKIRSKISTTEALLSSLKSEMDRQKLRLCFIVKLNDDVLRIVFEMSSEDDWRSPLSIAAVCRQWRGVVHTTPKVWCILRLQDSPPLNIISTYLAHSEPRLLHLSTSYYGPDTYVDVINQNSKRIECLGIPPESLDMLTGCFPHLRQLDLGKICSTKVKPRRLRLSRFPSLLQLTLPNFDPLSSSTTLKLPPIQVLTIGTDETGTWLKILGVLEKTLVTLRIEAYTSDHWLLVPQSLDFPLLKYLEIIPIENYIPLIITAKTPSLRSYFIYTNYDVPFEVEVDFAVITHLHLGSPIDLALYPMIRHLRIEFHPDEIEEMIELDPSLCLHLESIEYFDKENHPAGETSFEREVHGEIRFVELMRCRNLENWKVPLPGQYPEPVSTPWVSKICLLMPKSAPI
jgi:hypothetical protein